MPIKIFDLCGANQSHRFSPYCWRAKMAILHKGFQIEEIPTPFTKIPEVAGGISATVPVVEDGDSTVSDSWEIAEYLERTYPDRPTLFGNEQGLALTRFVESWVNMSVNPVIASLIVKDIHDILSPEDQTYFRESREKRFGKTLEVVQENREDRVHILHTALKPFGRILKQQNYFGGDTPLYADYILYGSLLWPHVSSSFELLQDDDPIMHWFRRCQSLHGGLGESVERAYY